jgi:hypothetical protein
VPEEVEEAKQERVACGLRPLEAEEELIDAETFSSLHVEWTAETAESSEAGGAMLLSEVVSEGVPGAEAAPADEVRPLGPEEVAEIEVRLATAPDRHVISDCALHLARSYAAAAALFVVRRDVIRGCGAVGSGVRRNTDGLFVPLASASLLAATVTEGEAFRGALPADGIDEQLFRAIGRCDVREAAILPVRIRDRVLNVLYVDNGPHPLAESSIAALGAVCDGIARAYARLILLTKRRHC